MTLKTRLELLDEPALTTSQTVALTGIAIGLTWPAVARHMGIGERTVGRHLAAAAHRLSAHDTMHTVALAAAHGLLDPEHLRQRTMPPAPPPSPRGKRLTHQDLQAVAQAYRYALDLPGRAVAETLGITPKAAAYRIARARKAGLLPPQNMP